MTDPLQTLRRYIYNFAAVYSNASADEYIAHHIALGDELQKISAELVAARAQPTITLLQAAEIIRTVCEDRKTQEVV